MKLSEVFATRALYGGDLYNSRTGACCLLGAIYIAEHGKPPDSNNYSYDTIAKTPTGQKVIQIIKDFCRVHGIRLPYSDDPSIIWKFSDTYLFHNTVNLDEFLKLLEQDEKPMTTKTSEDLILEKLESFIKDQKTFTAFEVTMAVRADGDDVKHYAVRPIVHQYMETVSGYDKGSAVYNGVNAIQYVPSPLNVPLVASNPAYVPVAKYSCRRNARGGIGISAMALKEIGLFPGDVAKVYYDPTENALNLCDPQNVAGLSYAGETQYKVNSSGQVVITKKFVKQFAKQLDRSPQEIEVVGKALKIS